MYIIYVYYICILYMYIKYVYYMWCIRLLDIMISYYIIATSTPMASNEL